MRLLSKFLHAVAQEYQGTSRRSRLGSRIVCIQDEELSLFEVKFARPEVELEHEEHEPDTVGVVAQRVQSRTGLRAVPASPESI